MLGLLAADSGETYLLGRPFERAALAEVGASIEGPALYGHLSARENLRVHARLMGIGESRMDEVLQLVARGHRYREIGEQLFIAEKTVENHVRNILGKLHLSRRQELVRYAIDHGLE